MKLQNSLKLLCKSIIIFLWNNYFQFIIKNNILICITGYTESNFLQNIVFYKILFYSVIQTVYYELWGINKKKLALNLDTKFPRGLTCFKISSHHSL